MKFIRKKNKKIKRGLQAISAFVLIMLGLIFVLQEKTYTLIVGSDHNITSLYIDDEERTFISKDPNTIFISAGLHTIRVYSSVDQYSKYQSRRSFEMPEKTLGMRLHMIKELTPLGLKAQEKQLALASEKERLHQEKLHLLADEIKKEKKKNKKIGSTSFSQFVYHIQDDLPQKQETKHPYLAKTTMALKLKKELGVDIPFSLDRKDKQWTIAYNNVQVKLDKRDFEMMFKTVHNSDMRLAVNKKSKILTDGEVFHFIFQADQKAYVSVLSVYEDGTVVILVDNLSVKAHRIKTIPDPDFESELEAGLLEEGKATFDMYVAIMSDEPLLLDDFVSGEAENISDERYKNFDTLIAFIEDKSFTTIKVITKPK